MSLLSYIPFAIFAFFGALAVGSALLMIWQRNPMHSVLYLAFTVLAIAGVFFTLQADFVGAIQIVVYAGGVVVLYVFVIIIVNLGDLKAETRKWFPRLFLWSVPGLLVLELAALVFLHPLPPPSTAPAGLGLPQLATQLLSTYLIPFEVASLLLLAAMVGAILVARKKVTHDSH